MRKISDKTLLTRLLPPIAGICAGLLVGIQLIPKFLYASIPVAVAVYIAVFFGYRRWGKFILRKKEELRR